MYTLYVRPVHSKVDIYPIYLLSKTKKLPFSTSGSTVAFFLTPSLAPFTLS